MFTEYVEGKNTEIELNDQVMYVPIFPWIYNRFIGQWEKTEARQCPDEEGDMIWMEERDPSWYKKKRQEELRVNRRIKRKAKEEGLEAEEYVDEECEAWRMHKWGKRINGEWVMIKDRPVYIPGCYYFYLHTSIGTKLPGGKPAYWEAHRKLHYLLQFAYDHDFTLGIGLYTKRRGGKTGASIGFMLDRMTRAKNKKGGIQSKTEEDAKGVVFDGLVTAFNKMPHYWRPKRDKGKTTSLVFTNPSKSKYDEDSDEDLGLESVIEWRSSVEMAFDGWEMHAYIGDEWLKTKRVDVMERHEVVKHSCMDYSMEFVAKAMYTSTCEETNETKNSIEEFIQFYEDSNPKRRDEVTGKTKTGLISCFIPADELMGFDKFGMPDIKKNREIILAERAQYAGDNKRLYSLIRKNPLTIIEYFRVMSSNCHYDAPTLYDRIDTLSWSGGNLLTRVSLEWMGERAGLDIDGSFRRGSAVKIVESANGNFLIHNPSMPPIEELNRVKWAGRMPAPLNVDKSVVGIDPVDHNTNNQYSSRMAAYGAQRRISLPVKFFIEYYGRPKLIRHGYEDLLKLLFLLSCKGCVESNRPGMGRYAEQRGFRNYLIHAPGSAEPGFAATTRTKDDIVDQTYDLIIESIEDVWFIDLCQDWVKFDVTDTRKYDKAMAAGWTVYGDSVLKRMKAVRNTDMGANDYFRKFKQSRRWQAQ